MQSSSAGCGDMCTYRYVVHRACQRVGDNVGLERAQARAEYESRSVNTEQAAPCQVEAATHVPVATQGTDLAVDPLDMHRQSAANRFQSPS